jgi:hypothetical protein
VKKRPRLQRWKLSGWTFLSLSRVTTLCLLFFYVCHSQFHVDCFMRSLLPSCFSTFAFMALQLLPCFLNMIEITPRD